MAEDKKTISVWPTHRNSRTWNYRINDRLFGIEKCADVDDVVVVVIVDVVIFNENFTDACYWLYWNSFCQNHERFVQ